MVRRLMAFWAALVLTVSGALAAQETNKPVAAGAEKVRADLKEDVRQLLTSGSIVDQAWGAYYTGKYGFTDLAPLLWSLVDPANENYRDPQQRCIRAALIDLGATADAEKFELLRKKHWDLCALTAAINGESAEQLVTLMREVQGTDFQIATCNKLVDLKHAEVSKELLSRITIGMEINVWDAGRGGVGRKRGMMCGDGHISVPDGYPPIVDYSLRRSHPRTGDTVLATGPTTIYLRRREVDGNSMGVGSVSSDFDIVQYRLSSLYRLSGQSMPSDKTTLKSIMSVNIRWSSNEAFETAVEERANDFKTEWEALKGTLVEEKLLTEEDSASLPIAISLSITDLRDDKSQVLPTAEALEAKLFGAK